jgi:hypothetical protein
MHPLARGATAAAVFAALAGLDRPSPSRPRSAAPPVASGVSGMPAPCAPGTLPEGPVCVRIPGAAEVASARASAHLGPAPQRGEVPFERIPRMPERPADPAAYVYPAGAEAADGGVTGPRILAGVERPGIRVAVRPNERVRALALEGQVGPAEVVFAGDLYGVTVVTAHTLEGTGRKHVVLLFHGALDHAAPGVVAGAKLDAGADLGFARTDLKAGLIDVYFEAREVRDGAKLDGADGRRLTDASVSVATDLRNVLPLR